MIWKIIERSWSLLTSLKAWSDFSFDGILQQKEKKIDGNDYDSTHFFFNLKNNPQDNLHLLSLPVCLKLY